MIFLFDVQLRNKYDDDDDDDDAVVLQAVVELRWGPRGPGPPERPGGPAKHLFSEGSRGL